MIIKKIEIGGFGKLEKYSLNLEGGVQIIYGENEFGKSTLMEFIKIMFYSRRGGEKSGTKDKELRKKYAPWSGCAMKGSIEFIHLGSLYKLQKEISSESPSKDKTLLYNLSVGETVKFGKKEEAGEYLFGIDVKSFERSSYISGIGKIDFGTIKNSKDGLTDKILSNLSDTGEEDVSKSLAVKRINDAIRELQWSRGNGGKIFNLKNDISQIAQKIYSLKALEQENEKLAHEEKHIKDLRLKQESLTLEIDNARKYKKLLSIENVLKLHYEMESLLNKAKLSTKEIEEILQRSKEFKTKLFSLNATADKLKLLMRSAGEITDIFKDDIENLRKKIEEKEYEEKKLSSLKSVLSRYAFNPEENFLQQNYDQLLGANCFLGLSDKQGEYKKLKQKTTELIFLQKNANLRRKKLQETIKLQEKELQIAICRRKSNRIKSEIAVFFGMATFALSLAKGFPYAIFGAGLLLVFAGLGVYLLRKGKKNMEFIKKVLLKSQKELEEASKLCDEDLEIQINNVSSQCDNLIEAIRQTLNLKIKEQERILYEKVETINDILNAKKCDTIGDYYAKYAQSQNFSDVYSSYEKTLKEIKITSEELVCMVSKYKIVTTVEQCEKIIQELNCIDTSLKSIMSKIKYELALQGHDGENVQNLKARACELRACCKKTELLGQSFEEAEEKLKYLRSLNLEEKYIEIHKNIHLPKEDAYKLNSKLQKQKEKLSKMEDYLKSLNVALEAIEESSDEMRKSFNPKLDSRASEIFSFLTSGKYRNIHIAKDYNILVSDAEQERICENFSSGTIDQAYFALRFAISEVISDKGRAPLILDDTFMQYDDARLNKALDFLKEYSKAHSDDFQAILFTCHKNIVNFQKVKKA